MKKGCSVDSNSAFVRNAHEADLSVRFTMFRGYPSETEEDLNMSAQFLEDHSNCIDRVRYNEMSILESTAIYGEIKEENNRYPQLKILKHDPHQAQAVYLNTDLGSREYRSAKARVLKAVYSINQRTLRIGSRAFDGWM